VFTALCPAHTGTPPATLDLAPVRLYTALHRQTRPSDCCYGVAFVHNPVRRVASPDAKGQLSMPTGCNPICTAALDWSCSALANSRIFLFWSISGPRICSSPWSAKKRHTFCSVYHRQGRRVHRSMFMLVQILCGTKLLSRRLLLFNQKRKKRNHTSEQC
jgi:hypothetical protein